MIITQLCLFIRLNVKFIGEESHAADTPWDGVNALDAAFMAYGNIAVLRQQMKPGWRVHGDDKFK